MRTIIAGSRSCSDFTMLQQAIKDSGFTITVAISGCARGVDMMGERWARYNHIPVERFPAQWSKFGVAAGPIRNRVMAENAEALVALWDGSSDGTKHMIATARNKNLAVFVYTFEPSRTGDRKDAIP